ncbi:unnamed protein product [Orchesella dallaii]|uniref:Uncharacterized protein n=1 Tax=Orchesella dallaii TaxID=48710 RepID=A0ABP1PY28_9HEXA
MRIFLFATLLLLAHVAIDGGLGHPVLIGGNGIKIQQDDSASTVKGNSIFTNSNTNSIIAPLTTPFLFLMNKLQQDLQMPSTQPDHIDESDLSIQNARDALLNRQVDSHKRGKRAAYETWKHWFYSTVWPVFKGKRNFG